MTTEQERTVSQWSTEMDGAARRLKRSFGARALPMLVERAASSTGMMRATWLAIAGRIAMDDLYGIGMDGPSPDEAPKADHADVPPICISINELADLESKLTSALRQADLAGLHVVAIHVDAAINAIVGDVQRLRLDLVTEIR